MKKISNLSAASFLAVIILAVPYLFISSYGSSSIDHIMQVVIVVIAVVAGFSWLTHLFDFRNRQLEQLETSIRMNFVYMLIVGIFIVLLIEDALVYDRVTYIFYGYIFMFLSFLFAYIKYIVMEVVKEKKFEILFLGLDYYFVCC